MVKNWVKLPNHGYFQIYYTKSTGHQNWIAFTPRPCATCGEQFLSRNSEYRKNKGIYCSASCRNRSRKHVANLTCEWCHKSYAVPWAKRKIRRYCGPTCASVASVSARHARVRNIYLSSRGLDTLMCERCLYENGTNSRKVHISHKNGLRSDTRPGNLRALCGFCRHHLDTGGPWELRYKDKRQSIRMKQEALRWTK